MIDKLLFHSSYSLGMCGGSRLYSKKMSSCHSCASSFGPFTVDSCTLSHAPVFITIQKWCVTEVGALVRVSSSDVSERNTFLLTTYFRPSRRITACSTVQNFSWYRSTVTRCPVMAQDAVQFSGVVLGGSERARPTCFTSRRVIPRP